MTTSPSGQGADESTTTTAGRRGRIAVAAVAASVFLVAAIVGAYLDWIWWPAYAGIVITLAAGAILLVGVILLLVGVILALIGHGSVVRIALIVLAGGIGLVAGQNLGPSREPLVYQRGGTMTVRLESPLVDVATGPAICTNVASETEFAVESDLNMRLADGTRLWGVNVDVGDRWGAIKGAPRKDGVRLDILGGPELQPDDGRLSMVVMGATSSSTLESTFSNEGGSVRFAGLEAQPRQGWTGDPIDFAGTLEWTCGATAP